MLTSKGYGSSAAKPVSIAVSLATLTSTVSLLDDHYTCTLQEHGCRDPQPPPARYSALLLSLLLSLLDDPYTCTLQEHGCRDPQPPPARYSALLLSLLLSPLLSLLDYSSESRRQHAKSVMRTNQNYQSSVLS
ncbi:hypothetical protein J6590_060224 [Homalodisca vitripennis]|nr:hypothetical protein J6590_060224 [Homalodisca vitripennis]